MFKCRYSMKELVSISETGSDQLTCAELAGYLYNARKEIERQAALIERAKNIFNQSELCIDERCEWGACHEYKQWLKDAQGVVGCDCHNYHQQVCDICQGVKPKTEERDDV